METAKPRVKVGTFVESMDELEFTGFEIEKPLEGTGGYHRPCKGDSGSAHWITNYQMKAVVVATVSKGDKPCGSIKPRITPYAGEVLQFTSSPLIHYWIKKKAHIT